jgi:large subunit ribosomal protein L25
VVYGGGGPVVHVEVAREDLEAVLRAHQRVVRLDLDGRGQSVLLRDLSFHPIEDDPLHVDFLRITETSRIKVKIPLHFEGSPKGVAEGGEFVHTLAELEVECLPGDIPESIAVRVGDLLVGQSLTVADLTIPPRVTVLHEPATIVCLVHHRGEEEAAPAAEAAATPTEPERIGRKAEEAEPEEGEEKEKGKERERDKEKK